MSYIRMDKGLPRKPKFRRLARETGLADHELVGYLFAIWSVVDEIGQDLEGTDEDIACAVCAPSALLCALCAVGWATRFEGGITFNTNDPTTEDRTNAHRARAARSYERRKGVLRAGAAQTAQSAPPSIHPTNLSNQPNQPNHVAQNVAAEVSLHAGPNASLNFMLSRDPEVVAVWNAIPKSWAKERGKNLPKIAAAIQAIQGAGMARKEAAATLTATIDAYCQSDEGGGTYARSLGRWLDAEGWLEDPAAWKRVGDAKSTPTGQKTRNATPAEIAWGIAPQEETQ